MSFDRSIQEAQVEVNVEGDDIVITDKVDKLAEHILHGAAIPLQHVVADSRKSGNKRGERPVDTDKLLHMRMRLGTGHILDRRDFDN